MRKNGLSIIEFLIALAIIAVVMLAVLGLQTTSLKSSRQALRMQQATALAKAEIERLRSSPIGLPESCSTKSANGYALSCTSIPCVMESSGPRCETTVSSPTAYRIQIEVSRDSQSLLQIQTVIAA